MVVGIMLHITVKYGISEKWFKRKHFLSRALVAPFSAEQNYLCNFGNVHHEEQFCEILLNLDLWFRRFHLETFFI